MKKIVLIAFVALLGIFAFQGCKKAAVPITNLQASKTQIVVGEIDNLLFTGGHATDSLNWTVSPANAALNPKENTATITFGAPGAYVITAQKAGGIPASVTIKAVASTGTDITQSENITTSTVDTLQLVPIITDIMMIPDAYFSKTGDSVIVNFEPCTDLANKYCGQAILQYKSVITAANSFNLDLINLREAKGCAIAIRPYPFIVGISETGVNGIAFQKKWLTAGTYPLTVTINGVTRYSGSFTVSAKKVTFNWPYTSGVTMTYKVLPR